jgi:hypothetical protein
MYLRLSDATASLRLSGQRKRDLLAHDEADVEELDPGANSTPPIAFSSEVDSGSREENASKQKSRARF